MASRPAVGRGATRGDPPSEAIATPATDGAGYDRWCADHLAGGATLRRQERSIGGPPGSLDAAQLAKPNAVLEVHFADGSVFYTDPVDFVARHGQASTQRGSGGTGCIWCARWRRRSKRRTAPTMTCAICYRCWPRRRWPG